MRHVAAAAAGAIVACSVFATGVGAQAVTGATLDQSNTALSTGNAFGAGTWGQTFLAGVSGGVSAIDLYSMNGLGGSVSVNVETLDASGAPSGTVIGTGTATALSDGWFSVPIASTAGVAAGTEYAFVYTTATANIAFNRGPGYDGSEYPNGASYNGTSRYGGYDFLFREYVSPLAAALSGAPTSDVPIGRTYSYAYTVGGGATTSLESGALPPGLTLSSGGVLSGIPTLNGSYTFTVTASLAASSASTTSTIVVRDVQSPGQPTGVTATAGNGSANVSWIAPANPGDDAITGYTVTSSPGGISTDTTSAVGTIAGLTPGTAYSFRVTATSAAGTGATSEASDQVTPYTTPEAPRAFAAVSSDSAAALSWAVPASDGFSALSGYVIEQSTAGGAYASVAAPGPTETTARVTGLSNGSSYSFRISAVNAAGTGPAASSAPIVPAGPAGAPTSVSVASGSGSALVSWAAPVDNGGAPISGYAIGYRTGTGAWTTKTVAASSPATIAGLANGVTYEFRVSAVTAAGAGTASAPIAATPFAFDPAALTGSTPLVGTTATAGDSIHLHAAGLPSGATVIIELHSVVTTLATLTIGSDGILDTTVTIPAGTAAGSHHLSLTISGSGLYPATSSYAFTVAASPVAVLAFTGGSVPPAAPLGGALALILGALLMAAAHRPRRAGKGAPGWLFSGSRSVFRR